jgi:NADPH:quinone reductase-like Zn-dependent oxidoreductase
MPDVAVPAALVAPLDTSAGRVSMEAGAALIVNGPTALLALTNLSAVSDGSAVVVTGATGALGSVMAQVAQHLGDRPLIAVPASRHRASRVPMMHAFQ